MTVSNPGGGGSGGGPAVAPSRAYCNTGFTTTAGAYNKIPVNVISFDPAGNMSVAQGRYNVPANGFYHATGETETNANPGDTLLTLYRNGTVVSVGARTSPQQTNSGMVVDDVLQCVAGDYIELFLYTTSAVAMAAGSNVNYLCVVPL